MKLLKLEWKCFFVALLTCLGICTAAHAKPAPEVGGELVRSISFTGTSGTKKKTLRFKGNEKLFKTKNKYTKLTQYFSVSGKPLLWDKVTFNTGLEPTSYVRWGSDSSFNLEFTRTQKNYILSRPKKKPVSSTWGASAILPKVLHEFVIQNKNDLAAGIKKEIQLFLPDLGRFANFWVVSKIAANKMHCLLYTSPSPRDRTRSRMPSSA